MALESAQFINQLVAANPGGSDRLQQGDDHIRLIKATLKATFPNLTGAMTLSQDFLNRLESLIVPVGLIAPFSGETAPTGWAICNGQTVEKSDGSGSITTPDLRGRVVAGVSSAHALGTTWGQETYTITTETAGGHGHTASTSASGTHDHGGEAGDTALTVDQMPAHSHGNGVGDNAPSNLFVYGKKGVPAPTPDNPQAGDASGTEQGLTETIGGGDTHTHTIADGGDHTHEVDVEAVAGHAHEVEVAASQPTAAFTYIMKI